MLNATRTRLGNEPEGVPRIQADFRLDFCVGMLKISLFYPNPSN